MNMKEAYCNFEISQLLKKKGFDELTYAFYAPYKDGNVKFIISKWKEKYNTLNSWLISAPTHQSAMRWLREKNIGILPGIQITQDLKERYWYASIVYLDNSQDIIHYVAAPSEDLIDGYDKVIEQALEYILKNLI